MPPKKRKSGAAKKRTAAASAAARAQAKKFKAEETCKTIKEDSEIPSEWLDSSDGGIISYCTASDANYVRIVGLRGLVNLRNTCYLNSVIQVLVHTPCFVDVILERGRFKDSGCNHPGDGEMCLTNEMRRTMRRFLSGRLTPMVLISLLEKYYYHEKQNGNTSNDLSNQQDAHEVLVKILEVVSVELSNPLYNLSVEEMFHGTLKSTVRCLACKDASSTTEAFMSISLDVFGRPDITLEKGLARFTQVEELECGSCVCCGSDERTKEIQLETIPLIFCIHIKRLVSNTYVEKWKHHVKFGLSLTMNSRDITSRQENTYEYSLYAIVVHKGPSNGGHYFSYVRHRPNVWIKCDDEYMNVVSVTEVLEANAYMLFYNRIGYDWMTKPNQKPKPTILFEQFST